MKLRFSDIRMLAWFVLALVGLARTASGALLFENGPLSTGVLNSSGASAPAGTTWTELQAGNDVVGYGVTNTTTVRLTDDFTVPAGGWTIEGFRFFGFRTGSGAASEFNLVDFRIWDGVPDTMGSNIVFGDSTTNLFGSSSFTNIYRITGGSTLTNRPVMQIDTEPLVLDLLPGTYWVDYQLGTSVAGFVFTPPVTVVGQQGKPGADARQSTGGAFNPITSGNAAQDLPFEIFGTEPTVIPEPSTLALFGLGLAGLAALGLLRRRQSPPGLPSHAREIQRAIETELAEFRVVGV